MNALAAFVRKASGFGPGSTGFSLWCNRPGALMRAMLGLFWLVAAPCAVAQEDIPLELRFADAMRLAEAANPDYLAAQRHEGIVLAEVIQARMRPNPTVELMIEEFPAYAPPSGSRFSTAQWIMGFGQEIETAGKRRHRSQATEAGLLAAKAGIADFRRTLHAATGVAYFALARAQSDYLAVQSVLGRIGQVIDLVEERVSQGDAAAMALLRLRSEQVRLEDDLLQASLTQDQSQVILLSLLGAHDVTREVDAADSLVATTLLGESGEPLATPEGVVMPVAYLQEMALRQRADLQAARHEVARAEANVALQRAMRIPNLEIGGGYRGNFEINQVDAGMTVGLPLWSGLDGGGVALAEAAQDMATASLKRVEAVVKSEIARAAGMVDARAARVTLVEQQYLAQVEDLLQRMQTSYSLGEASLLDLIDVQRNYLEALLLRNEAVHDFRLSQIWLAATLGITPRHESM